MARQPRFPCRCGLRRGRRECSTNHANSEEDQAKHAHNEWPSWEIELVRQSESKCTRHSGRTPTDGHEQSRPACEQECDHSRDHEKREYEQHAGNRHRRRHVPEAFEGKLPECDGFVNSIFVGSGDLSGRVVTSWTRSRSSCPFCPLCPPQLDT